MSITLTSPEAAVAATPYLIGFTPVDSLVMLLCEETGLRVTMRIDLPDCPQAGWLIDVLDALGDPPPAKVLMIVYADTTPVSFADSIADWVACAVEPLLEVLDCLVVHDGRFRSLCGHLDDDGRGVPLDSVTNHPVVAACVAEGLARYESRDDVVNLLEPVVDDVTQEVIAALDTPPGDHYDNWRDRTEVTALALLRSREALTAADVALLGQACCDIHVRDPLVSLLTARGVDRAVIDNARTRLEYVAVHLPDNIAGGVAATIALLCWMRGDWPAAYAAADRGMSADPANSLAPLVLEALHHRLPPDTWVSLTRDIPLDVLRGRTRRSA